MSKRGIRPEKTQMLAGCSPISIREPLLGKKVMRRCKKYLNRIILIVTVDFLDYELEFMYPRDTGIIIQMNT